MNLKAVGRSLHPALISVFQTWQYPRQWICFFDEFVPCTFEYTREYLRPHAQNALESNLGWMHDYRYVIDRHTYNPTHSANYNGYLHGGSCTYSERLESVDIEIANSSPTPMFFLYKDSLEFL